MRAIDECRNILLFESTHSVAKSPTRTPLAHVRTAPGRTLLAALREGVYAARAYLHHWIAICSRRQTSNSHQNFRAARMPDAVLVVDSRTLRAMLCRE